MRNTPGSLRAWLHGHPLIPDVALAVAVAAAAVSWAHAGLFPGAAGDLMEPDALGLALVVAGCLSPALRRHMPFTMLFLVSLIEVTLASLNQSGSLLWVAALTLVYTVAAQRGLALSLCALLVSLTCRALLAVASDGLGDRTGQLFIAVLTTTLWIAGRSIRLRRAYLAELRDRAERTERARESDTRAARAEERSRIARELHDVVAHHVSVMTVQASAARRVLATNPDGAREALSAIEEMGRTAMAEMRNIVGVLRTDTAPAERNPQPGVQEIPALVDQMREAGLRTQLWMDGAEGPLPPGVDLAAYRLVQEALTNSLRHAGPQASAWVTVRQGPGELAVQVEDDGHGPEIPRPAGDRTGHGLVGIRERVALYGGVLRIGPRPEGGFEVNARFPLKDVP
ncbi:signal transduction histidine kinase [Streptosporangium album]|uniref:histidine kinase n=1 Tax=Streptosporangium album TaxID=47479 RepID=A0A7W7WCH6_9ACTN|nr:sensor histidine kinase [Streptosporangium album]MBB4942106.1 signal transduction histidine kinase [Streptosporangium album]